jgi:hypothetical protein
MQWPIQVQIPLPNWFMGLFKLSLFIIYHILFNVQIVSNPFPNHKNWKLKMRSYILGEFKGWLLCGSLSSMTQSLIMLLINNLNKIFKLWKTNTSNFYLLG